MAVKQLKKQLIASILSVAAQHSLHWLHRLMHGMSAITPQMPLRPLIAAKTDNLCNSGKFQKNAEAAAADYLLSLINDILQMSKIEDGNVPLTQEIINFEELRMF